MTGTAGARFDVARVKDWVKESKYRIKTQIMPAKKWKKLSVSTGQNFQISQPFPFSLKVTVNAKHTLNEFTY